MKRTTFLAVALVASLAAHASDILTSADGDTYTAFPRTLQASKLANGTTQYDMLWQFHIRHSTVPSDNGKPIEERVQIHVTGCALGMGELWVNSYNPLTVNKWLREGTQVFDEMALKMCEYAQEAGK